MNLKAYQSYNSKPMHPSQFRLKTVASCIHAKFLAYVLRGYFLCFDQPFPLLILKDVLSSIFIYNHKCVRATMVSHRHIPNLDMRYQIIHFQHKQLYMDIDYYRGDCMDDHRYQLKSNVPN